MPEQPTLSDMIRQQLDKGVTYAELEERSVAPGTGRSRISDSQLNRLAKGTATRIPTEEQLRGIAAAVRRPYESVRQAAIAQWLPAEDDLAVDERENLRTEALRLRQIADEALARADDALARIDRKTGGSSGGRAKSA